MNVLFKIYPLSQNFHHNSKWKWFDCNRNHNSPTTQTPIRKLQLQSTNRFGSIYFTFAPTKTAAVLAKYSTEPKLIWNITFDGTIIGTLSISNDETLFVPCFNMYFYALDPTTGSVKWKYFLNEAVESSSVISSDNILYFAGSSYLFAMTLQGSLLWSNSIFNARNQGGFASGTPSLGFDGMLYLGTEEGYIFAINSTFLAVHSVQPSTVPISMPSSTNGSVAAQSIVEIIVPIVVVVVCLAVVVGYWCQRKQDDIISVLSGSNLNITLKNFSKSNSKSGGDVLRSNDRNQALTEIVSNFKKELVLNWKNIYIHSNTVTEAILGNGSFGVVIRAKYSEKAGVKSDKDIDVAVKVLTRSSAQLAGNLDFKDICLKAYREVVLMANAESKMIYKDCMVHVLGIVEGRLPDVFTAMFRLELGEPGIGIVMSFEGGGSLETFLGGNRDLPKQKRIHLVMEVAKCLMELHALRIVHGDLKPANVLLHDQGSLSLRLADFGLSTIIADNVGELGNSSLQATKHSRGTPLYCAPEMLVNPFSDTFDERVAKASRKTDIYAFALLAWQALTMGTPFSGVRTEAALCAQVHQGTRPPLEALADFPSALTAMITACWDHDRSKRLTAAECFAIVNNIQQQQQQTETEERKTVFDVFVLNMVRKKRSLIGLAVFSFLSRHGFNVHFNVGPEFNNNTNDDKKTEFGNSFTIMCVEEADVVNEETVLQFLAWKNATAVGKLVVVCTGTIKEHDLIQQLMVGVQEELLIVLQDEVMKAEEVEAENENVAALTSTATSTSPGTTTTEATENPIVNSVAFVQDTTPFIPILSLLGTNRIMNNTV